MRVAVIGGGATGCSVVLQVLKRCRVGSETNDDTPLRVPELHLFERDAEVGRGRAYRRGPYSHIINLPSTIMSPYADDPTHFERWWRPQCDSVQEKLPHYTDPLFAPRAVFGDYLTEHMREEALDHITTHCKCEVKDVQRSIQKEHDASEGDTGIAWLVKWIDATGVEQEKCFDHVVLCTGHTTAAPPLPVPALADHPHYIADPWTLSECTESLRGSVLIVGSHLTALDVALVCAEYCENITVASRSATLPSVLGETKPTKLEKLTHEHLGNSPSLEELVAAFEHDVTPQSQWEKLPCDIAQGWKRLDREISQVSSGKHRAWQSRLFELYRALADEEKLLYLMKSSAVATLPQPWKTLFMARLAAMPLVNARRLQDLHRSGQLSLKHIADVNVLEYDVVINATGCVANLNTVAPFYRTVLECDHAETAHVAGPVTFPIYDLGVYVRQAAVIARKLCDAAGKQNR